MKKRIWNQLKKAAVITVLAGTMGNCMVSASEFSTQEEQKVLLKQSAQWTDEKNFRAEISLELNGLKELYAQMQKSENTADGQQSAQNGQAGETRETGENVPETEGVSEAAAYLNENEPTVEVEQTDEDSYAGRNAWEEEMQMEENSLAGGEIYSEENEQAGESGQPEENAQSGGDIYSEENEQTGESGQAEENGQTGESSQTEESAQSAESVQGTGDGQTGDGTQQVLDIRYFLTAYVSEYFQVEEAGLKNDIQAESVKIQNKKGQETEITKLTCEVPVKDAETDTFSLKIPVSLREEYRISPVAVSYPVCQDELTQKEQTSKEETQEGQASKDQIQKEQTTVGAYLWKKTGEDVQVVTVSPSASLQIAEAKTGLTADLQPKESKVRAGQQVSYVLTVNNTGELPLENIEVDSSFSMENIKASWEQQDGFTTDGAQGMLAALQPGETKELRMNLQLTESQAGELLHTVTLKTRHPGKEEEIGCQAAAKVAVEELKAAFEVEKTADRTQAYPGDTITYQICIRNTGERTLHSVLSTERFQNAGIQAKFVQKEGVTLSNNATQALIPQIAQGEAFALYATVTIPQYFTSQELVNEVTVISDETGSQIMKSQSNVTVTSNANTVTVTPGPTPVTAQTYSDGYGYSSKSAGAYSAASKPKTGDETETALYIVLGIFAFMTGISAFGYYRRKKQR